jgi:hypothetical protein
LRSVLAGRIFSTLFRPGLFTATADQRPLAKTPNLIATYFAGTPAKAYRYLTGTQTVQTPMAERVKAALDKTADSNHRIFRPYSMRRNDLAASCVSRTPGSPSESFFNKRLASAPPINSMA